jgi:uncharacterized metal-binding protein
LFFAKKNGGRRRNEGGGEGGRTLGHNLNITDGFTNEYYRRVYFIGIPSIKITRHRSFLFFFIPLFSTIIPLVYTDKNILSMFTKGYSEELFCG